MGGPNMDPAIFYSPSFWNPIYQPCFAGVPAVALHLCHASAVGKLQPQECRDFMEFP